MDWSHQGLSSDSIYVILDGYSLDVRTAAIQTDSVLFTNKLMFSFSLNGSFVDKITRGKQAENYPKFVSYSKDIVIKDVYPQVDYKEGINYKE